MAEAAEKVADDLDQTDPNATPADDEAGQDDAPAPNPEAEKIAQLLGWKPRDQWKGDDSGWRSAEDFLKEVPDVMRKTRKTAARVQEKLDKVVALTAKLEKTQVKAADAALQERLAAAVEAGDLKEAAKVLAEAKASTGGTDPDEHPAFTAFKERNEWFNVNDDATAYAEAQDKRIATRDGITDPAAHMKKVELAVKAKFPELFGANTNDKKEDEQRRAPLVGRGGRTGTPRSSDAVTVNDLTKSQREAAESMAQYGVTLADYVKSLNEINAREKARA